MKYKKSIIILVLVIFIFGVASVCASDISNTVIANDDTGQIGLSTDNEADVDNLEIGEEKNTLSQVDNDESMSVGNDSQVVGSDVRTYSGLSTEIGRGGNITLKHEYYSYDLGSTIEITVDNSFIDGKGAVIDMNGSNIRAFQVSASGVTFKNLTIKNVNFLHTGGAIYFNGSGNLTNCNFIGNYANNDGGAVFFLSGGNVSNCNFTGNSVHSNGGAIYSKGDVVVTNCNFTANTANYYGGAVFINKYGDVSNCIFTGNTAHSGGAVFINKYGDVSNCIFTGNTARSGGAVYFGYIGFVIYCSFITALDTTYNTHIIPHIEC